MNLPNKIDIGFRTFDVVLRKNIGLMGSINNTGRLMQLDSEQRDGDMLDTVMHECLHAMISDSELADTQDEEKLVTVLANKLTELWLRNPKLLDWLHETVHKEIDE